MVQYEKMQDYLDKWGKPCPFCGGKPVVEVKDNFYGVKCGNKNCFMDEVKITIKGFYYDKERIIKNALSIWNDRYGKS